MVRVVGAGIGRTGTMSLKLALEQLLGGTCHHMIEVFAHPDELSGWAGAAKGESIDWRAQLDGYSAIVDWPGGAYWREISAAFPDSLILLSTRSSAQAWFKSANDTIFKTIDGMEPPPGMEVWAEMVKDMMANRFTADFLDADAATAAYEAHNAAVRAEAPAERLVDWQPGDGWEPICAALDLAVPDTPFPHTNTTEEFLANFHV